MRNNYRFILRALEIGKKRKGFDDDPEPKDSAKRREWLSRLAAYKHIAQESAQDDLEEIVDKLMNMRKGGKR